MMTLLDNTNKSLGELHDILAKNNEVFTSTLATGRR